jgi:hypothetical protein
LVRLLIGTAKDRKNDEIREAALSIIAAMCSTEITGIAMFTTLGAVEVMFDAAKNGATKGLREEGFRGLGNLTDYSETTDGLVFSYNFLDFLAALPLSDQVTQGMLNCAVSAKSRAVILDHSKALNYLTAAIKTGNKQSSLYAQLAMAILVGSDEKASKGFQVDANTLRSIIQILRGALQQTEVFDFVFPLAQPLVALRYLTTVDDNRTALGTQWLSMAVDAIKQTCSMNKPVEAEAALACLLQYSFDAVALAGLRKDASYSAIAKQVINEKSGEPRWAGAVNTAKSFLFILEGRDEQVTAPSTASASIKSSDKQMIMISYSWGPPPHTNKKLAAEVEAFLKTQGYDMAR